jgi:signal transduction histidine kinase
MSMEVGLLVWTAIAVLLIGVAVWLVVGFVRGVREGLRNDSPAHAPLRTMLFRTVLVTLLVLVLLIGAVIQHQQRDDQWPANEGMQKLNRTVARGAPWIDQQATESINEALLDAADAPGQGSGELRLDVAGMVAASGFSDASLARLRDRGWDTGSLAMHRDRWRYVAWRANANRVVYYVYQPSAWYTRLWRYLIIVAITAASLSPFAAAAAWYLNRRIVKPVQQGAEASVVLAEGGTPMPVPTKAPLELSVLAQSFNLMAEKLRKAQETERDFLMSVGHELKTPLTSIDGYAELLQDEAVDPKKAAEILSLESSRLRRLIADLLDLARIGRSEFTVVDEPVDLAETAREVVARFETLAATLGVALVADAPAPALARGDTGRLLQAASNLVENALRATRSGDRVDVVARPGLLSVRDTGPGLTEEDVEHAFERFYLHRKYGEGPEVGTGLGLAIVKDLAEAMGGSVDVTSEAGAGSTFSVRLPAPDAESSTSS